jgi:hypothetical protein
LDEQSEVEGECSEEEREAVILDATSLKLEKWLSRKNYWLFRKRRYNSRKIIWQPRWKSLKLRRGQVSTVSLFGKD